jgi:hypothetical protein
MNKPALFFFLLFSLQLSAQVRVEDVASEKYSNNYFDEPQLKKALAKPQKAENVLFGLIDPFTKQPVSYTRVTVKENGKPVTDADIISRGGVYKKKGKEYFRLNYSTPLDVRFFGAIGNGIEDDTEALQNAMNYCSAAGIVLSCGSGLYRITRGLTASCSVVFDAPTYGSKANSGFVVAADNITALTFTHGIRSSRNITIHGDNKNSNGVFFDNNLLSRHENLRVYNLNGFGFKGEKFHDSQLDNISVELCGSEKEYAFSMLSGNDTWNMTIINRLQVEQSKFKAIYFDPLGLSCIINDIHAERATGVPKDGQPTYVLGGNRCQYNTMRIQSSFKQKVFITAANSTFINCLFESALESVTVEGFSGNTVTFIGTESQCAFQEKSSQVGKILVYGGKFSEVSGYHNNSIYNDADVGNFNFGYSNDPSGAVFRNCRIGNVQQGDKNSMHAARFENCIINKVTDLPRTTFLAGTTVKSAANNNLNVAYRNLFMENSTVNANVSVDFGAVTANNSKINGDLVFRAGPKKNLFSGLSVLGKVATQFLEAPDVPAIKGMVHSILGTGQWIAKEVAGKTSWQKVLF